MKQSRAEKYATKVKTGGVGVRRLNRMGVEEDVDVLDYAKELGEAVNLDMGDGSTLQVFPSGKTVVHLPDLEHIKSLYDRSDFKFNDQRLPPGHPTLTNDELKRSGVIV